jgi:Domain of unknown function (DUF1843)
LQPKEILEPIMTLIAYGTAINQALASARTKLEDLKVLRDHATAVLEAQGDLKGALRKLNKEIKTRESAAKKKK